MKQYIGKNQKSHAKNLRKGRYSETGRIYHITTTTFERKPIFRNIKSARILINTLRKETPRAKTLAFVVMPDHLHWLMQLEKSSQLKVVLQSIKSISSHQINQMCGGSGRIWHSGYHDHALRKDEDLKSIARYIVANPLRAGLVEKLGDYPYWDAVWL